MPGRRESGVNNGSVPVRKYAAWLTALKLMKNYEPFYITEKSINLKKELDNYAWKKDPKSGKPGMNLLTILTI